MTLPGRLSRRSAAAAAALLLAGCRAPLPGAGAPPRLPATPLEMPPLPPREFRGAWVASVDNIDWPSAPGLPSSRQQIEALALIDRAAAVGLNALLLQVRPAADAIYPSALEPWSEYVSGEQGVAMDYDPLAFWIDAAHRRGLELHAWFNPFRARHASARSPLAATHLARRQPDWVKRYANQLWLDPGLPPVQQHTLAVIADVAARYDIDGVHIDDYFYPYPVADPAGGGGDLAFDDEASWQQAQASGNALARDDWRRANVDRFVSDLYQRVHAVKPWLRVGISPFGLPSAARRPAGISGFDARARLYADAEHWLDQGWLDYVAPQLYWPLERPAQAFAVLLDHWAQGNAHARHLWPGLFTSSVAVPPRAWPADEVLNQIAQVRGHCGASGHVHFSMTALLDNRGGVATRLQAAYAERALVPATPWLGAAAPPAPSLVRDGGQLRVTAGAGGEPARWFVLWQRRRGAWDFSVLPAHEPPRLVLHDSAQGAVTAVVAASVSRSGVHGPRVAWRGIEDD